VAGPLLGGSTGCEGANRNDGLCYGLRILLVPYQTSNYTLQSVMSRFAS